MKQALRPLSAGARSALPGSLPQAHTRGLVCASRPASRVAGCRAAPRARRGCYEACVRRVPAGSRGYWVKAGEEGLSEEAKKRLDDQNKANLGKSELPVPPTPRIPLHKRSPRLTPPQRYPSSKNASRQSSSSPSPPRSLPQTSPSTSSPPPTRTSPSQPARQPTRPPSGPLP